jgi:hypothetical protein
LGFTRYLYAKGHLLLHLICRNRKKPSTGFPCALDPWGRVPAMKLREIVALAALCAWSSACAPAADTRVLTPAEKEQLVREHEAIELRRRLGVATPQRPGCAGSSSASRLMARENRYSGSDSFDSRGCPEESMGRTPPAAPSE